MTTQFERVPYISLRSYKKDGGAVDTPVWIVEVDGKLYCFTLSETFKVKRVARNPRVQVAKCDVRGRLLGGWVDGTCRAIPKGAELEPRVYAKFVEKYGWQMRIGNVMSSLAGRMKRRVLLEITLDEKSAAA
jgi:PPOX class probable F420-dependent enzyme